VISHNKAGFQFFGGPGRREAASLMRSSAFQNVIHVVLHQFRGEFAQSISIGSCKLAFNCNVLSFHVTKIAETFH
jgi:hypothetical protein